MPTENEQSYSKQFDPWSRKVGGLLSGPGRHLYDVSTHAPIQEAAKYPLLFSALQNLVGGRNTKAFDPIEAEARNKYHTETVPSIAERFAGRGGSGAEQLAFHRAGVDLERGLASDRAKFGQEEERLRQSGLDQLLKFGMQPTSEKILMQKPEGEIPPTFENKFVEKYGPHAVEVYNETKNWAEKALGDIEDIADRKLAGIEAKPEAERGRLESAALKGGRALQPVARTAKEVAKGTLNTAEKVIKRVFTPTVKGTAAGQAATEAFVNSPEAQNYPNRIAGNAKAEQFTQPEQQRQLNEIMDIAGVKNANELELFNPKNRKTNKNKISYEAIQKFNELAHDPAMAKRDPNYINVLRYVRDEKEIERMRLFFTLPNPSRTLIPSHLAKKIPYFGKVRNKSYPTPRRGR